MKFFIEDSSGKKSLPRLAFSVGFLTVTIKILLSGFTINGLIFEKFSGVDYGAALAALGAIYVTNKKTKTPKKEEE